MRYGGKLIVDGTEGSGTIIKSHAATLHAYEMEKPNMTPAQLARCTEELKGALSHLEVGTGDILFVLFMYMRHPTRMKISMTCKVHLKKKRKFFLTFKLFIVKETYFTKEHKRLTLISSLLMVVYVGSGYLWYGQVYRNSKLSVVTIITLVEW